jgi:glycosyltransferase involved in cell wall biosynthesis
VYDTLKPQPAPMRVLLAHNYYRSSAPSGEDEVVRGEQRLLEDNGFDVIPFVRRNDDLPDGLRGALGAALSNAWSFDSLKALRALIRESRPDVAHFHNTFPQISPAAYVACREAGVPVVQTLHNYRMFCANGLLNRDGQPCELCVGRNALPALIHACYRDSRLATAGMALGSTVHRARRTYQTLVDRFIVLTRFAARRFIAHGLPASNIVVRGNCLPFDPGVGVAGSERRYALFVGRLTAEKGAATMLRAWRHLAGIPLRIAGDGALRAQLEVEAKGLPVEFLGRVPSERVFELMQRAAMIIVPSECYEGFPRVVVEAFATGTPLVVADLGGLRELVEHGVDGIRFRSGSADELAAAVSRLWQAPAEREKSGASGRARFEREYSPAAGLASLRAIYRSVAMSATPADHVSGGAAPQAR